MEMRLSNKHSYIIRLTVALSFQLFVCGWIISLGKDSLRIIERAKFQFQGHMNYVSRPAINFKQAIDCYYLPNLSSHEYISIPKFPMTYV